MCTKFRLFTGDPIFAIEKEGDCPVRIKHKYMEVIVSSLKYLDEELDALESGLGEGENPMCSVYHFNEKSHPQAESRPS